MLEANFLDVQALESAAAINSGEATATQGVAEIRYSRDGNISEIRNEDGTEWRLNEYGSWIKYDLPGKSVNGVRSLSSRKSLSEIELPQWINKL